MYIDLREAMEKVYQGDAVKIFRTVNVNGILKARQKSMKINSPPKRISTSRAKISYINAM